MASRYSGSRYDGDNRNRSRSRDRSPDRYNDRASQYSDGGPRRASGENRANNSAFQTNRDSFRDTLPRDTPRGPRALLDAPSGPRGGGISGEFRGRGRGRGRGWRDDSRDRGRDRDIDFRDRRDSTYRDERSRERERDWRDRDRDSFRGRRPSPRGRSPPGRDFRDLRDAPLGVDAERARRGSRDGPLSAGSSNSDPPFGPSSYRGGFGGRGRGRGRGGDRDRGRGRGFYDDRDRDRYGPGARARSQEGRFRDRDDREREPRFFDSDSRPRDLRDDRDIRERENRAKMERTSHEPPPSTRDVSPPPIAPAAPSFGSIPNRTASISEATPSTGKAPPTGPRALKDERPLPPGPATSSESRPPVGPSKPPFSEGAPPIPSGPRAHSGYTHPPRTGPSSKQWINPNLKGGPESPKMSRSQNFVPSRFPGYRPESSSSDQPAEADRRPRSSDAKESWDRMDGQSRDVHMHDADGDHDRYARRPRSAGSFDRDYRQQISPTTIVPDSARSRDANDTGSRDGKSIEDRTPRTVVEVPRTHTELKGSLKQGTITLPRKQPRATILDQSSESDDEEFGDVIENDLLEAEQHLKKLEVVEDAGSMDVLVRYSIISLEAANKLATDEEGLQSMIGHIPEPAELTKAAEDVVEPKEEAPKEASSPVAAPEPKSPPKEPEVKEPEKAAPQVVIPQPPPVPELPHPSIEQDVEMTSAEGTGAEEPELKAPNADDQDVVMEDVADIAKPVPSSQLEVPRVNGLKSPRSHPSSVYPEDEPALSKDGSKQGTSTPSPPEDDDETDVDEDIDLRTVETVRVHMTTPPLDSLPDFNEVPWHQDQAFLKTLNAPQPGLNNFILKRMNEDAEHVGAEQSKQRKIYEGSYEAYLRFTLSDDNVAVKSREKFTYIPGASDVPVQKPGFNSESTKPESTRRSRYATERDMERILEESRRQEEEKRERQLRAEKEKYRSEKEAIIPDQFQTKEEMDNQFYVDETGRTNPEKVIAAWEVLAPTENFSEEEIKLFEKAYMEFPKQWGRVANALPERDFGTTIQFYYLKKDKDELNLKEKLKKRPRQRKRRGGKGRSSALVSELAENEESQDTGENGERRRPRRAAAPTFNSEATPAADSENATGASTPGRRGAAARTGDGTEKPERKPRGRRAKDKTDKQPRPNQTLAAAPPATTGKGNRSRSSSRVQNPEWTTVQPPPADAPHVPSSFEVSASGMPAPPVTIQPPFTAVQPLRSPERTVAPTAVPLPDMMAPPLRPEPPQPGVMTPFEVNQRPSTERTDRADRKTGSQASSYWSVSEANDFPFLLSAFGSDWAKLAAHMGTKTPVMVKNYYLRQKENGKKEWEERVSEADAKRGRGEKLPVPPPPSQPVKKGRFDTTPLNRTLVSDTVMEDASPSKIEPPAVTQPMTGRFNVPIAAQPQAAMMQSPFSQATTTAVPAPAQATTQPLGQPISVSQTMSPTNRPLRAPFGYPERDREVLQTPTRTSLPMQVQAQVTPVSEPPSSMRHPLPGSAVVEAPAERQKMELKPSKEQLVQERTPLRVKQEPDVPMGDPYSRVDPYVIPQQASHMVPRESMPLSRAPEPPRTAAIVPPRVASFDGILQQQPVRGTLMTDMHPSSPAPPRPLSTLSQPRSDIGILPEYNRTPPMQSTPPAVPPPSASAKPKTSNIMSLLNDDPPPQPKRVSEVPSALKSSATPPPTSNLSRPPPAPPAPTQMRQQAPPMSDAQNVRMDGQPYGHFGRPPPSAPSSAMPPLKPYTASPQTQPLSTARHMTMESQERQDRDYYGRQRQFSSPHQTAANSPQAAHPYPPPTPSAPMPYQSQSAYPYGAPVPPPSAASPPPQYGGHSSVPRGHEPPPTPVREMGWPGPHSSHGMQQQQTPQPQQVWAPKSAQPPPAPSPWAAQHAASTPKPPPPSSSVPPQTTWAAPRTHDPRDALNLRDARDTRGDPRDMYHQPHRSMQPPMQAPYAPVSRAAEPPPPQPPSAYPRYANTPVPGRDPRDPGPQRSYTPNPYDHRGAYPPPPQDMRDAQLREQQQQSILHQQLRPQDPPRNMYDRGPLDRYGR
ncbi:myb-like DNA-binding domain-containing protein [Pestalotiopsis sp. NC0098]|nr:myb-like DNA-binding domain-containing protein [Pestalotiopsis sp. NC0098]